MEKTSIKSSLRIMGDDYNIDEITKILGVTPSRYWKKGGKIRNSDKNYEYTAWIYNTEAINTLDIEDVVCKIYNVFFKKKNQLLKLKKKYSLDISVDFCVIIEGGEVPALYFEKYFIDFCSEICAIIDIDIYVN